MNAGRGDELRAMLWHKTRRGAGPPGEKLRAGDPEQLGFPIVEVPLAEADDLDRVGRCRSSGGLRHPGRH